VVPRAYYKFTLSLPRCVHCMQRGLATRKLSVRLSNAWIVNETEERSVQIFIPYESTFSLVFCEENGWWGDPFYLKFWVKLTPLERNRRFSVYIRS